MSNVDFYDYDTRYGEFRTSSFGHLFPDFATFKEEFEESPFATYVSDASTVHILDDQNLEFLWAALYARYANDHIAASDPNRAKWRIFSLIAQYGPTWQSRLEFQRRVQRMTVAELQASYTSIHNVALHDQTAPSTSTTEELPFISQQDVSKRKRSEIDAIALRNEILKVDVTEQFLKRFAQIFCKFVGRRRPLLYANPIIEEEPENE